MTFVHLHVHSPFSFLDGASSLESLVRQAAALDMPALALTDHNSLAGAVKFSSLCQGYGLKPILGVEVTMEDASHLTLLAQNRAGYTNLCRLLTRSYLHGGRLTPCLPWTVLPEHAEGVLCLTGCRKGLVHRLSRDHQYQAAEAEARKLLRWFGPDRLFVELSDDFTPDCHRVCRELHQLAEHLGVRAVVTNNVHYAVRKGGFAAHDVLRCVHAGITLSDIHPDRPLNFEQWLKPPQKVAELFHWCPEALANTVLVAEACELSLPTNEQATPHYPVPEAHGDSVGYLRHLIYKGAVSRYKTLTSAIQGRLDHELNVIATLGYTDYMLLAWKVARWARSQGIRVTGRGSAADSCVAYALMLTDVDVIQRNLPFARFLAEGKVPDVDLDFDARRRDEVFRWLEREYGAGHVAMCCTFHTYRAKSVLRDVGKVLGLPSDVLRFFTEHIAHFVRADQIKEAFERNPELKAHKHLTERFRLLFDICKLIAGFPRHIGTHSSGVVVSRVSLDTIAALQPTAKGVLPLLTLDKDDAEAVGLIKLDVLSLRILSAVEDAAADIRRHEPEFRYNKIPDGDEATYRMIRAGSAMGVFQLESPAQMALASVLSPEHFEDLVASVALIRPGPIRSNAVKRFVAARNGWCRIDVLHPCLREVLAKTYGCVVFQEQVVQVIAAMLGCSEADADRLRKRLAKHDKEGTMEQARNEFLSRACAAHPDLSTDRALLIWQQVETWSGYGFTEGHAASFALTSYKTAYLAERHPAEYFAALMSNQPMGFYDANTLAAETRRRGVQIRPVDVNRSVWKCFAEEYGLRLGFCLVQDLREEDGQAILAARKERPFVSLLDFCARVPIHRDLLDILLLAGAFDGLHEHRRGLLWRLDETIGLAHACRAAGQAGGQAALALGDAATLATPLAWDIEDFTPWEKLVWEWRTTGICAASHPLAWMREALATQGARTAYEAKQQSPGARVMVAGLNLRPHRPPTRSGRTVLFSTIEDETDYLQATCVGETLERLTTVFLLSPAVIVQGIIERKGTGASLKVEEARPLHLRDLTLPLAHSFLAAPTPLAIDQKTEMSF